MHLVEKSIITPQGFRATGVACGLKPEGMDLALIISDRPACAAGMFTTNQVKAPPLQVNRENLQNGQAQAIVVNSKNANACTGKQGLEDARRMALVAADHLGLAPKDILINSTGVIGVPLPMDKIESGLRNAVSQLKKDGWNLAAEAMMTTDTVPKKAAAKLQIGGKKITVCGIAKGAGMIAPNMATMLAFLATDAGMTPELLKVCLQKAVEQSFNCITVDGDMSTNDTVLILANGSLENGPLSEIDLKTFQGGLNAVCNSLAKQIAKDGEGATKLITIRVKNAASESDARTIGLSVANSNLVKTAVFGRDPNWGRILCAIGYSGVLIKPDQISVSMAGIPIYQKGFGLPFDHDVAIEALELPEIYIDINLDAGNASATLYTCDLTYDYIRINAEYTT